jgi:YidC/Oxa1 family membrane protein insertase
VTPPGQTTAPTGTAAPAPGAVAPGSAQQASPGVTLTREAALAASQRVAIETPSLSGSISLKGGRIDDVVLSKYHETVDPKSPNIVLFSPSHSPSPYFAEFVWTPGISTTAKLPDSSTEWRVESGQKLTPSTPVTLSWDNGGGLVFRRTYSIDNDYMVKIDDSVENKGSAPVSLVHDSQIARIGTPHVQGYYILHEGLIGIAEDKLQEVKYADILKDIAEGKSAKIEFKDTHGGWLGITDKYWAVALVPDQQSTLFGYFQGFAKNGPAKESYQVAYRRPDLTVAPGATASVEQRLFAGAKEVKLIERYRDTLGIKQFDMLVDWGWFWFITKPLYMLLHWLAQFFGNYGLAILATTVLVKAAFFPLANKSYESMAKMKALQPEMERIRAAYKDDRARQQQEMMELYKKQKINPMSGCLPIVLQIPVFFALYKVLFVTIDMRHAPFFGWIKDLSVADPTSLFNLFGLLPYAVPEFLHIGVWPIIMGITMWFQMQLNPQQPDPMQQKIFNWMPVLFTFMLGSFPAGLVIYWAWNNVLSLLQQYAIMRRNGTEIHLWKNLGIEKWLRGGTKA